ncbi:tRNA(fMet)-specific endonuclease VapC [ANME-1 cluster archaeon GoMg3.2]|nr:tRNA(fMet)-specific endonuclease VapC [ANME-1 cluster archaeon GoMg3.2]
MLISFINWRLKNLGKIFIDSSVFVAHCMVGDETLVHLFEKGEELFSSPNVIEESFYKSLFLKTEQIYKKGGKYLLKEKYIKERANFEPIFKYFNEFVKRIIETGTLKILPLNAEISLRSIEISWKYGLLPNDALITATCKHHGITKIATFDSDFKRVDFLEVVELEG